MSEKTMDTKTLDLRGMIDAARDANVTETVATMAGWTWDKYHAQKPDKKKLRFAFSRNTADFLPAYAESVDAVLPLLENLPFRVEIGKGLNQQFVCVICGKSDFAEWGEGGWHQGIAQTLARACCYALLRVNGIKVLT